MCVLRTALSPSHSCAAVLEERTSVVAAAYRDEYECDHYEAQRATAHANSHSTSSVSAISDSGSGNASECVRDDHGS